MHILSDLVSNKKLGSIQTYEPGKPVEELERELGIKGAIKMASNENPFGPSPKAVRAIAGSLKKVNRYPDSHSFYLREALAKKFRIAAERIVLGNGSDELIVMALRAFLGPSQEAVMAVPSFLIYRIATLVQGGNAVEVPMKNFRYDLKGMAEGITEKTKVIFIANPDNPVGTYVTHEELNRFVNSVPSRCLIFIDEAYYEFACQRRDYPKSFAFLDRPNVILTRTFSKAYGLSGLRIGYAFSSPQVARSLNKVREPFNVNLLAQAAALAALKDTAFVRKVIRTTEAEKRFLRRELMKRGIETLESATNFLLLRVGRGAWDVYESLLKSGVIVRTMKEWGMADYLRVTVGTPRENRIFLRKLSRILKHMDGGRRI